MRLRPNYDRYKEILEKEIDTPIEATHESFLRAYAYDLMMREQEKEIEREVKKRMARRRRE